MAGDLFISASAKIRGILFFISTGDKNHYFPGMGFQNSKLNRM
jgi:hypothetical protein